MAMNNDNCSHNVESHSLYKFNSDGKFVKTVGVEGGKKGQFDWPHGIAISKDNKLFLCDSFNHRIQVFDTFLRTFGRHGSGLGELATPWGICVDHDYIYVIDWGNHRISHLEHFV